MLKSKLKTRKVDEINILSSNQYRVINIEYQYQLISCLSDEFYRILISRMSHKSPTVSFLAFDAIFPYVFKFSI